MWRQYICPLPLLAAPRWARRGLRPPTRTASTAGQGPRTALRPALPSPGHQPGTLRQRAALAGRRACHNNTVAGPGVKGREDRHHTKKYIQWHYHRCAHAVGAGQRPWRGADPAITPQPLSHGTSGRSGEGGRGGAMGGGGEEGITHLVLMESMARPAGRDHSMGWSGSVLATSQSLHNPSARLSSWDARLLPHKPP